MGFRTQWRGQRDTTSRRRFWKLLLLSLVLHAPLTPLAALVGLLGLLVRPATYDVPPDNEKITAIPVNLLEDPDSETAGVKTVEPKQPPAAKKHAARATQLKTGPRDAGVPVRARRDAGDAGSDAGRAVPRAGASVADPVALSGSAGHVANAHANVRLIIYTDHIRHNPLGARIGALLGQVDQWHDFFGPTGLDPIADIDRILIAGPQLRNSSNVVVVLRYNTSAARMKRAIGALVARDTAGGGWLDAGVPAARARGDRAERVFVMPAPHILVVAPPSARKSALALSPHTRFPDAQGDVALSVYVRTPWRAFIGIPFRVPKSIAWVRMKITPTADGGATATVVAEDASPDAAARDADYLMTSINAVTQIKLGIVGALFGHSELKLIEPVSFVARGKRIVGLVRATPKQLGALLGVVAAKAREIAVDNARAAAAQKRPVVGEAGAPMPAAPSGSAASPPASTSLHAPKPGPSAGPLDAG